MSESDPPKRRFDPNATIQIDLDQVQLDDARAASARDSSAPVRRTTPPPLPPPLPIVTLAPPPKPGRTVLYVAVFVVLIGLGIAGGLLVGMRARRGVASIPAALPATTASATSSVAPSASSAAPTLTLPTIEIH
jgi:hypothetical protein